MSAFMVKDEVINGIVSWLSMKAYDSYHVKLAKTLTTQEDEDALANKIFQLNIQAIEERYGPGQAKDFRPLDFKYKSELPASNIVVLKALQCLLYQCSEGDVPKTQLFQDLKDLEYNIMKMIIGALPEYEQAPWG